MAKRRKRRSANEKSQAERQTEEQKQNEQALISETDESLNGGISEISTETASSNQIDIEATEDAPAESQETPQTEDEHQQPQKTEQPEATRTPESTRDPSAFEKGISGVWHWIKCVYFTAANRIYRTLYFVGIQLLRSTRAKRRKVIHGLSQFDAWTNKQFKCAVRRIKRRAYEIRQDIVTPVRDLHTRYGSFKRALDNAKQYETGPTQRQVCRETAGSLLSGFWRVACFLLNYIMPIAACILLYMTVNYFNGLTLALRVEYNGEELGYITDESVFTQAENDMKQRMILEDIWVPDPTEEDGGKVVAENGNTTIVIPKFYLTVIDAQELTTVDELTNMMILAAGKDTEGLNGVAVEEADGLYISGTYIGAVKDGETLLGIMNRMKEKYRTSDMAEDTRIQFVKKVQVKRGLYPVGTIRPVEEIETILNKEERGEKMYTVVKGDDPLKIAAKNGITFRELKNLNPEVDIKLFPGDEVLISQSVPYLGVKVTTTLRYEEEMEFEIKQQTDPSRNVGTTYTKQEGKKGLCEITAEVVMVDGIETERNIVGKNVLKEPVDQIVVVGGNKPLKVIPKNSGSGGVPSGALAWPTSVHRIGTGYLGYYGHTGADIVWGGCYGSPVYASAAGTVVASGWGGAYGYRVIIDHGNNLQTLYAHCSKLAVGVGQWVEQGAYIGNIGRTGNVTGPHLHFEVRPNGVPVNPAPYLYG